MTEYKFLDDLAKFGNNTLTAMTGAQRQVRKWVSEQVDSLIKSMDLITREDFEVQKDIAQQALTRAEELEKRIQALEAKAGIASPVAAKPKRSL